jgi:hypothetical protein
MDALSASRAGLPWCASCEVTEGEFVMAFGRQEGSRIMCVSCAAGRPQVPITSPGGTMSEQTPEDRKTEQADELREKADQAENPANQPPAPVDLTTPSREEAQIPEEDAIIAAREENAEGEKAEGEE